MGNAEDRFESLKKLGADAPLYTGSPEPERLFAMIELLANRDPYQDVRYEAVRALAAFLPRPSARAALKRVAKPDIYTNTAWAAVRVLEDERVAEAQAELEFERQAQAQKKALADIEGRAEAALAAVDTRTLYGRLRRTALTEALAAYRAATDAHSKTVIQRRLADLLSEDLAAGSAALGTSFWNLPEGVRARTDLFPKPWSQRAKLLWMWDAPPGLTAKVRALTWGALLPAVLTILLSAGAALTAIWALAPAAAAAAGGTAAFLGTRFLLKPVPTSSRDIYHAPRNLSAVPVEFRPVVVALDALAARLGVPAPSAAIYQPEDPRDDHGGWNAQALGARLSAEAAVAVGSSWVGARRAELDGVLAHELGHLALGDNRRLEAFRRAAKLALWTLPFSAAALLTGLWLMPALAAVLSALSLLAGASLHRTIERRADLFSAWLAGPEAARAFLTRLADEERRGGGGLSFTHPTPASRLRDLAP
jgi:Zn-dependent protease with chaperone function